MATTIKRSVTGGAGRLPGVLWTLPGIVELLGELAELGDVALAFAFVFVFVFVFVFALAFLLSQSAIGSLL
jgi:hypothetical protein